jgi:hypothetical protein
MLPTPFPKLLSGLTVIAGLCSACATPSDPFTTGPGHASVHGLVTDASGAPVPSTTVRIACAGGVRAVVIPADSNGGYLANLVTSSDAFAGRGGRLQCRFTEPATGLPRVQVDTTLGFARGPVLVVLQIVDLHEP